MASSTTADTTAGAKPPAKLHGRAFYESIGSPKYIVAPMVDQSEFAWRLLTRSFLPEDERGSVLAYSPMLHARLFADTEKYRDTHFQPTRASISPAHVRAPAADSSSSSSSPPTESKQTPYLDGNPALDRPLFVQFCANDPQALLAAARVVAPHCDAVDLNFGCPQGIARKGRYGAFLQEDQQLVHELVRVLHENLPVPVTAKIRILETKEATLAYARNVLAAGASILTVHGRRRDQKGHLTGVADWGYIRYLREHLPRETVLFANGNVLQHGDLRRCLEATGADGVMSAEGNLSDPAIFAPPPPSPAVGAAGVENREYWRGKDGKGGYRVDAILRRYLDIMHKYVLEEEPPTRRPLFVPGDDESWLREAAAATEEEAEAKEPARKKQRREEGPPTNGNGSGNVKKKKTPIPTSTTVGPNFVAMKAHLFHLLRHFVSRHHDARDALARGTRLGDMASYEAFLDVVERRVAEGLLAYERTGGKSLLEEEEDGARNGAYDKGSRGEGEKKAAVVASKREGGQGQEEPAPRLDENNDGEEQEENEDEDDPDSSVATVRRCKRPWWVAQPIVRPLPKEALAKGAVSLSKKDKLKLAAAAAEQPQQQQEKIDNNNNDDDDDNEKDKGKKKEDADAAAVPEPEAEPEALTENGTTTGKKEDVAGRLEEVTDFQKSDLVSG